MITLLFAKNSEFLSFKSFRYQSGRIISELLRKFRRINPVKPKIRTYPNFQNMLCKIGG
jgi:hypothetical protein